MELREYQTEASVSPFSEWFGDLDAVAAAKVTTSLARLELGNTSNTKGVGAGVYELKIDFGPGYRVYFGKDGNEIVHPAWWRHKEAAGAGYRCRERMLAGLQDSKEGECVTCR